MNLVWLVFSAGIDEDVGVERVECVCASEESALKCAKKMQNEYDEMPKQYKRIVWYASREVQP